MGVWLSIVLAIGFISVYAWQITEESRQLADALAATELVLAREQHLSQLDGLAAAAAHELGTPLSTISVIATRTRTRDRSDIAARRRRPAAARAGAALPRHSRQAHRAVRPRRAVRPHAAVDADRGSGGAAPRISASPSTCSCRATGHRAGRPRATRRSSTASATCWRTPSISRASSVEVDASVDRRRSRRRDLRRRPGLRAGHAGPDRRALCSRPQAAAACTRPAIPASAWRFVHRQDPAGTIGRSVRHRWRFRSQRGQRCPERGAIVERPLAAASIRLVGAAVASLEQKAAKRHMYIRPAHGTAAMTAHCYRRPICGRALAADRRGRQVVSGAAGARHGSAAASRSPPRVRLRRLACRSSKSAAGLRRGRYAARRRQRPRRDLGAEAPARPTRAASC